MTQLIAEIGWNHMGDMSLAKKMISAAAESGADYAKFQTWKVSRLKPGAWDQDGRRQIYEKAELSPEKHRDLRDYCKSQGIRFLSSVFSVEDAKLLKEISPECVKVPSFESANLDLLHYVNDHFDRILLSTGASLFSEIEESLNHVDRKRTTLLHCVSSYPCNPENANLPRIAALKGISAKVGYSDHVKGIEVSKAALQFDLEVLEKHFTTDNDLPGRDNKFALLPREMRELKDYIDLRNRAMISHGKDYQPIEADSRQNYRGRFNG